MSVEGSLVLYQGNVVLNKPTTTNPLIYRSSIAFENFLRISVVRNTQLDNINLAGETRFTIDSIDTIGKTITITQTIPDIVKYGTAVYGTGYKWAIMKDYANGALIDSITDNVISYTSIGVGSFSAGNTVTFYNPFMNYKFEKLSSIINLGSAGTWNSLGQQSQGMWRGVDGIYRMIIFGTNTAGGSGHIGYATSTDLNTWSLANGGNYMYFGNEGPFSGITIATNVWPNSNPIKLADNSYLSFFTCNPSASIAEIRPVWFDDDFVITNVGSVLSIPGYPMDYIDIAGGCVMLDGVCYVYLIDRGTSTPSTWKIIEAVIPDVGTMTVTSASIALEYDGTDTWHGLHTDAVAPFVWNNTIYLWAYGTGANFANSILNGNREAGLIKRNSNGTFSVDVRSPLLTNPIAGLYLWDSNMNLQSDHMGGGTSIWVDGTDMHVFCTMNASSNTYRIFHTIFPLTVP